ncbi:Hpt domain-containing protein [Minwuia sp.]|uniref:Hpt domain-containing protein n=1 Tax=Minwuia sp. TaxID=2493630 RepID=UPI003A949F66
MNQPRDADAIPLLDDGILADMAGGSGDDVVAALVEGFLEEARDRVAAILKAAADHDEAAVGFQAHALKSTSATYGALRLRQVAADLERAAREGDSAAIPLGLQGIEALWRETDAAFRARFLTG